MEVCFFTVFDDRAKDMATGMINSVKKWYPDIPMEALEIDIQNKDAEFDLKNFCQQILTTGMELLEEYKRIIYIDPDSVMCNLCPDLFGDFELGVVQNNTPYGEDVYVNAGLVACTNKEVWKEILKEYERLNNISWNSLNHQNALNQVYHTTTHETKLLETDDKCYGITGLAHYQGIELRDKDGNACLDAAPPDAELYLPSNKKLCVFHAAGTYWKTGTKINFDFITNELARETMKGYTC